MLNIFSCACWPFTALWRNIIFNVNIFSLILQGAFSLYWLCLLHSFKFWYNWIFFFCCLCSWCHIKEITAKSNIIKFSPNCDINIFLNRFFLIILKKKIFLILEFLCDRLRQIPLHLMQYPARAIKVLLAGFKPPLRDVGKTRIPYCPKWSMEALWAMIDCLQGKQLYASSMVSICLNWPRFFWRYFKDP